MAEPAQDPQSFVMVVDDEEDVRESLRDAVELAGCPVKLAKNGAEALDLLASQRPCLIILDLLMPVMTGAELLSAMRSQPALADVPVVISTSAPHLAPPGVPVLQKPVDLQRLWQVMRDSCRCAQRP